MHTIVTDQFVPKETQKIAGLQLFRTQNICNGLTGDVHKIVLILCTWQKYEIYLACKEWLVSATVKKWFIWCLKRPLWFYTSKDTDHDKLQCILLEFQGENIPWYCIWIPIPSDSSHEISFLIWFLKQKCCLGFFVVSCIIPCDN